MNETTHENNEQAQRKREERHEFSVYAWGFGIAIALTLVPFGLVTWRLGTGPRVLFYVIGAFGLAQMFVHFRCFLHLGLHRKREDLDLIMFSALILVILVGGTIWIMLSLAARMAVT